jgi:hypothetical protein
MRFGQLFPNLFTVSLFCLTIEAGMLKCQVLACQPCPEPKGGDTASRMSRPYLFQPRTTSTQYSLFINSPISSQSTRLLLSALLVHKIVLVEHTRLTLAIAGLFSNTLGVSIIQLLRSIP